MKTKYQIITTVITTVFASLHWIWYGLIIFIVIFNAETWFFGTKLSGEPALILHFSYGISGFIVGYLIYRQKRIAYVLAIILFAFMMISFRVQW